MDQRTRPGPLPAAARGHRPRRLPDQPRGEDTAARDPRRVPRPVKLDRFLQANGLRLHYLERGSGERTLVLVPGLTANAHSFDGLLAAGLDRGLRVLAFDARGRGLSDKPDAGYTMADHAADLLGALDALGLERVCLGGHS